MASKPAMSDKVLGFVLLACKHGKIVISINQDHDKGLIIDVEPQFVQARTLDMLHVYDVDVRTIERFNRALTHSIGNLYVLGLVDGKN